jgi:hypothetical protein
LFDERVSFGSLRHGRVSESMRVDLRVFLGNFLSIVYLGVHLPAGRRENLGLFSLTPASRQAAEPQYLSGHISDNRTF